MIKPLCAFILAFSSNVKAYRGGNAKNLSQAKKTKILNNGLPTDVKVNKVVR